MPVTPIRVWANPGAMVPCKHPAFGGADPSCIAPLLAAYPGSMVAAGGTAGNVQTTPGTPAPMSPAVVAVSVPATSGRVAMSVSVAMTAMTTNMATSVGFPWTTGMINISQSSALGGPELFTISRDRASGRPRLGEVLISIPAPHPQTGIVALTILPVAMHATDNLPLWSAVIRPSYQYQVAFGSDSPSRSGALLAAWVRLNASKINADEL